MRLGHLGRASAGPIPLQGFDLHKPAGHNIGIVRGLDEQSAGQRRASLAAGRHDQYANGNAYRWGCEQAGMGIRLQRNAEVVKQGRAACYALVSVVVGTGM